MIHFWSEAQRQRSAGFERWVEQCAAALRDPAVLEDLGRLGFELQVMNEGAILPNVRHEQVSVPRSKLDSDGVIILPFYGQKDRANLRLDHSALLPTRWRQRLLEPEFTRQGYDGRRTDYASLLTVILASQPSAVTAAQHFLDAPGHHESDSFTFAMRTPINGDWRAYVSRPLIAFDLTTSSLWQRGSPPAQASVGVRELGQAFDSEKLMDGLFPYQKALTVLRAYACQEIVRFAAQERGTLVDTDEHFFENCIALREICEAHNIIPDTLLNHDMWLQEPDVEVMEKMRLLGVLPLREVDDPHA